MSSGGGTTTQVTKNELPEWLQDAAQSNLARADYVSQLGYVPQYGLDVAGFTPMQTSAMQNTADAASAFGLAAPSNAMAGMPQQTTNNLGFSGYSSGSLYDDALAQLAQNRPAQYEAINSMFINPTEGGVDTIFTPMGSVGSNDAATINVNRMANTGSGSDYMNTDERSALAKYMAAMDYNRSPLDYPVWAPAGRAMKVVDPIARWANENYMDNFAEMYPQGVVEQTPTGFIAAGPDMYGSGSGYGGTSYDMGSASSASRSSSALGSGSNVGSGGGNASRGFSTGGW
jgi:hypothetical protein